MMHNIEKRKSIEKKICTFSPQINNNYNSQIITTNNSSNEPCFVKLYNNLKTKETRLKTLTKEVEQDKLADCSFQPKLNKSNIDREFSTE